MDVHSPKNCIFIGIDPYPFILTMIAKGLQKNIGHSHSPKTCSALFVPLGKERKVDSPLPNSYWQSLISKGVSTFSNSGRISNPYSIRYMSIMSRDLAKGWHETGQAGCHCAFVRLWPWQGMLKLMQQWLWPPPTQGCRCTTHFDTPCTLEASTLRTVSCSSAQSNQRILHIKNGQPAIIWTVTDWLMTKTKTSLPLEISSKSCKTAIVLRKPKMQRTLEIEEFTTTKTAKNNSNDSIFNAVFCWLSWRVPLPVQMVTPPISTFFLKVPSFHHSPRHRLCAQVWKNTRKRFVITWPTAVF